MGPIWQGWVVLTQDWEVCPWVVICGSASSPSSFRISHFPRAWARWPTKRFLVGIGMLGYATKIGSYIGFNLFSGWSNAESMVLLHVAGTVCCALKNVWTLVGYVCGFMFFCLHFVNQTLHLYYNIKRFLYNILWCWFTPHQLADNLWIVKEQNNKLY